MGSFSRSYEYGPNTEHALGTAPWVLSRGGCSCGNWPLGWGHLHQMALCPQGAAGFSSCGAVPTVSGARVLEAPGLVCKMVWSGLGGFPQEKYLSFILKSFSLQSGVCGLASNSSLNLKSQMLDTTGIPVLGHAPNLCKFHHHVLQVFCPSGGCDTVQFS